MTVFLSRDLAWYIAASARAVIEETDSPRSAIATPLSAIYGLSEGLRCDDRSRVR
jgi:hypothetical protein